MQGRRRPRRRSSSSPLCAVGSAILFGGLTEYCQAAKRRDVSIAGNVNGTSSVRRDGFAVIDEVDAPSLGNHLNNSRIVVQRNRIRRHNKDQLSTSVRSSKSSKAESPLKEGKSHGDHAHEATRTKKTGNRRSKKSSKAESTTSAYTATGATSTGSSAVVTNVGSSVTEQNGGIENNLRNRRRRHSLSTGVPEVGGGDVLETTPGQGTAGDTSTAPSSVSSHGPSFMPTMTLSTSPSNGPSNSPSAAPSLKPSVTFTEVPSNRPSSRPSMIPSSFPSLEPSVSNPPTSEEAPSSPPTTSVHPSTSPSDPSSASPSSQPSFLPSDEPSLETSLPPSGLPSAEPSSKPSSIPSNVPSNLPSARPSSPIPSSNPSDSPSVSSMPSSNPSDSPSVSSMPSSNPSNTPSVSSMPSSNPSNSPSLTPTTCLNYENCVPPAEKNFNIQLLPLSGNTDYDEDLLWAKQRWEEIIINDLVDFENASGQINFLQDTGYSYTGSVDDVVIAYQFGEIDGLDGILGSAGPVLVRLNSKTPASGLMEFDSVDFQALYPPGSFAARYILVHEMGHVLGIGVTGPCFEECGIANGEASFEYTCQRGAAEYAKIVRCAELATGPLSLKLEDDGGEGTFCSHWEDENFDHPDSSEMMTGFFDNSKNQPISRVTLGALEDMGYVVDYCAGEKYPLLDGEGDKLGTASDANAGAALRTESEPPLRFSLSDGRMKDPKIHYIREEEL